MRLHFAAELVLELAYQNLKGIEKIGAHIAQDKARIDFIWPQSLAPSFPLLEGEANRIIREDHPIVSAYSDEENERRYWEVAGFARVPCGGTHLKRTGEENQIEAGQYRQRQGTDSRHGKSVITFSNDRGYQ